MVLSRYICMALLWTLLVGITDAKALSSITAAPAGDGKFTISVAVDQDLVAMDISFSYDTAILSSPQVQAGAFASAAYMEANTLVPGAVRAVYMYTTNGAFNGAGQMATVTFTLVGTATGCLKDLKADGYSKSGQLVAIQPNIVCQTVPICTADQNLVNGVCVAKTTACSADQILSNGICVAKTPICTSDQILVNGACVAKPTFKVTASAGDGGSISPSGELAVNSGSITSFTLTPSNVYQIGDVSGCGGTLNGTTFTTGVITSDCTVTASFSQKPDPTPTTTTTTTTTEPTTTNTTSTTKSSGNMGSLNDQAAAQQAAQLAAASGTTATTPDSTATNTAPTTTSSGNMSNLLGQAAAQQAAANSSASLVNGTCGPANSLSFTNAPSTGLCGTGTAGSVTGSGPWSWACSGSNGGSTASCSASVTTSPVAPSINGAKASPTGIISGSGKTKPEIVDALRAIRIAVGLITPTAADLKDGDVAPLVNGKPAPDGKIDVMDAYVILQKSLGLVNW